MHYISGGQRNEGTAKKAYDHHTGNLELADAVDLNVPSGLEISEVQVASGDEVKEGDVLAVVDASSILEAMDQMEE